jgi:hypothetical protein
MAYILPGTYTYGIPGVLSLHSTSLFKYTPIHEHTHTSVAERIGTSVLQVAGATFSGIGAW